MNDYTYSNLGQKINRTTQKMGEFDFLLTLKDIIKNDHFKYTSEEEVLKAFCNDLKKLLSKETLKEVVDEIFLIENTLSLLSLKDEVDFSLPNLDHFYHSLSPILLRAIWENLESESNRNHVLHGWLESIRIAIEEELYIWQEKIIE